MFDALVASVRKLTGTVENKTDEIDQRMDKAETDFEQWKATTSFVQKYQVSYAEDFSGDDAQSGNYNLIKIYTIKNAYAAVNPWIHFGWTGGNVVGAGQFCSLAQSHASYTGQQAMFVKRGKGDVKFFVDRSNQNSAPVYIALKNTSSNNASIRVDIASYMALDVAGQGAVDITTWLADNPNVVEIDLVDITTQPIAPPEGA